MIYFCIHSIEHINLWFLYAEYKFGKRGSKILMADSSEVEDLCALREDDELYII